MAEALVRELIEEESGRRWARRFAVRELRPRRTLAGFAAALLVTAIALPLTIELLAAALGTGTHPVRGTAALLEVLHRSRWHDPNVMIAAGGLCVLGAAFLLAALPGRLRGVPLDGSDPRQAGLLGRAALRAVLADAALQVPGIERARVRGLGVFRRGLVVRAATRYRNPANLAELVRHAVDARLDGIEPMRRPAVEVRLRCGRK